MAINQYGQTPLHLACESNSPKIIQYLIEQGVDIEYRDNKGQTPLQYACLNNKLEAMKYLI